MSFQTIGGVFRGYINSGVFINVLTNCKDLKTLEFTARYFIDFYLEYLYQYKNVIVQLDNFQTIDQFILLRCHFNWITHLLHYGSSSLSSNVKTIRPHYKLKKPWYYSRQYWFVSLLETFFNFENADLTLPLPCVLIQFIMRLYSVS